MHASILNDHVMKIKLISPKAHESTGYLLDFRYIAKLFGGVARFGGIPPSIPTIAALTPNDIEVIIVDENLEPIDYEEKVDLVGITAMTYLVPRAYEIANEFRKRGSFVVLGGIHASLLPEEAAQYADVVIVGEAEATWREFIDDFRRGENKKYYYSLKRPTLDNSPIPRWDLLDHKRYTGFLVQTTRGCPFNCDFCSSRAYLGEILRHKPIENIIKEIQFLKDLVGNKVISFAADDNTCVDRQFAKKLFKALIPLKIRWFCQTSINIAQDEELLELAAESGAVCFFVGLESVSQDSLNSVNKGRLNRVEDMARAIDKIHSYGIGVFGSFVFGFDHDDEHIFERTVKFINDTNIAFALFSVLTPFPGTRLFAKFEKEGRLLHKRWEKYDSATVCFKPKLMSAQTLQDGFNWALRNLYSYEASFKRLQNLWSQGVWMRENVPLQVKGYLSFRMLKQLFRENKEMQRYILKSIANLWKPHVNLGSILYNLSFHDYAYKLTRKIINN